MGIFGNLFGTNVQNSTTSPASGTLEYWNEDNNITTTNTTTSHAQQFNQAHLSKAAAQANAAANMGMLGYNNPSNHYTAAQQAHQNYITGSFGMGNGIFTSTVQQAPLPLEYPDYESLAAADADVFLNVEIGTLMDLWKARFGSSWTKTGADVIPEDFKPVLARLISCHKLERITTQDKGTLWRLIE